MNPNRIAAAVLLLAVSGVAVGVYQLQTIYVSENQRSRDLLVDRKARIEVAASQNFAAALSRRMDVAITEMEVMVNAPFSATDNVFWKKGEERILPMEWRFLNSEEHILIDRYREWTARIQAPELGRLWRDDEKLLWRLAQAAKNNNADLAARLVSDYLNYDINHRDPSAREIAQRLLFAEVLIQLPNVSSDFLSQLLRNDLQSGNGSRLPGLQKSVLRSRNRLTEVDFEFALEKIVELCQAQQIPIEDFTAVAGARSVGEWFEGLNVLGPSLVPRENTFWYFEARGESFYGVEINPEELRLELVAQLRQQEWLAQEDDVQLLLNAVPVPVVELEFQWISEAYDNNIRELAYFNRLQKIVLAMGLMIIFSAGFFVWWLYRRQARWLGIKAEFVATVAHEMRTPLSSIRLMAERLTLVQKDSEEKTRDYAERIVSDIDTLSFLSENILSYERLESGQWVSHKSPLVIADLARELERELPLFVKKPFRLLAEGDDALTLDADPVLMKLLLLNLAKNGCSYTDEESAEIRLCWRTQGQAIVLDFIDNGVGIDPSEWQDCFVAFYRGKHQRHTRGSGLGLALCQKILAIHGGAIVIVSSSDAGTHFQLTFPQPEAAHD